MDTYQPIYDAVRSRLGNCDIASVATEVLNNAGFGYAAEKIANSFNEVASEWNRPSAIFRPKISIDGNMYCALYGDNLQDGVAGFGKSPADAMWDFDKNWNEKLELQEPQR